MAIQIQLYQDTYKAQVVSLFEDFQDYLISIDPIKRLCRLPGYGENTLAQTLEDIDQYQGKFYLATDGDQAVGLVVGLIKQQTREDLLGATPALRGRITELYLDEKYRGQGIGKKLMSTIEDYFREAGCVYAWVEVFVPNERAHGLYQKLGFEDRDIDMIKKL